VNYRKGTLLDELEQFAAALWGQDAPPPVTPAAFCKGNFSISHGGFNNNELQMAWAEIFGSGGLDGWRHQV
jgi:hypothetical protein